MEDRLLFSKTSSKPHHFLPRPGTISVRKYDCPSCLVIEADELTMYVGLITSKHVATLSLPGKVVNRKSGKPVGNVLEWKINFFFYSQTSSKPHHLLPRPGTISVRKYDCPSRLIIEADELAMYVGLITSDDVSTRSMFFNFGATTRHEFVTECEHLLRTCTKQFMVPLCVQYQAQSRLTSRLFKEQQSSCIRDERLDIEQERVILT